MIVKINGRPEEVSLNSNVETLVAGFKLEAARVVVELNEKIIKKIEWRQTIVKENDVIELISFVGGG
ncbi:MAG: sulfur carrier protein ThiS [Candidatus Margulisiibacteriota bacterium]